MTGKRQSSVKKTTATAKDAAVAIVVTVSGKVQDMIDALKKPFAAYVTSTVQLVQSRAELAPKFMKAFDAFHEETGGKFVDFCRLVDPTIPAERSAYRANSAYQAADYLRRLVAQEERGERKPLPASRRPATPYQALARLIATILPSIDPNGAIWQAFVKEMHWDEKMATRVRTTGAKLGPVPLSSRQTLHLRKAG